MHTTHDQATPETNNPAATLRQQGVRSAKIADFLQPITPKLKPSRCPDPPGCGGEPTDK